MHAYTADSHLKWFDGQHLMTHRHGNQRVDTDVGANIDETEVRVTVQEVLKFLQRQIYQIQNQSNMHMLVFSLKKSGKRVCFQRSL